MTFQKTNRIVKIQFNQIFKKLASKMQQNISCETRMRFKKNKVLYDLVAYLNKFKEAWKDHNLEDEKYGLKSK